MKAYQIQGSRYVGIFSIDWLCWSNSSYRNTRVAPSLIAANLGCNIMIMAARSNNAEIQTSELALQRSNNDSVRQYAQRMIEEHTSVNQQLEPLAAQREIELPTTANDFDNAILEKLTQVPDEQFDQACMDTQVNAHLKSLTVFRTGARQVMDADLNAYATTLLPSIQDHLDIATEMTRGNNAQLRR